MLLLRGQTRRLASSGTNLLAEDIARKIAHEVRASPTALSSLDQLGVDQLGPVQLAKYALARALIQTESAGASLYPPRPAEQTANGLSPADERLIRVVASLEELAGRRDARVVQPPVNASALTPATKADRVLVSAFVRNVASAPASSLDAAGLLSRWRAETDAARATSTAALTELKELRAHLMLRLDLDRQQRSLDAYNALQSARASAPDQRPAR
jgi:hypothetical protein